MADAAAIFDAIRRMGILPIGKDTLLRMAGPIALPPLVVVAMRNPPNAVLPKLGEALV